MFTTVSTWASSPNIYYNSGSLMRVVLSILILIFGFFVAKRVTRFLRNSMQSFMQKDFIAHSPVGMLFESTAALRGSGFFSHTVYWIVAFFFISIAGEMLGITFFSNVVALLISYIPSLISGVIVLLFGLIISGVVENVVKRQLKKMMPQQAVLVGTGSSYVVLTLFSLIALSEIGVASEFILVLFTGLVFALALTIGISLGFGSKNIVEDMLEAMVKEEKNRRSSE